MAIKLLIATPMYGGMCAGEYTRSSLGIIPAMQANGIDVSFAYIFNNSLITSARDQLAAICLKHDFTHMMFIDADIKFNAMDIVSMLKANVDVIGGIYPKKEINWDMVSNMAKKGVDASDLRNYTGSLVINLVDYQKELEVKINEPVEVFGVGTGFMLIQRRVLERLAAHTERYIDADNETEINSFFYLIKDEHTGKQLTEDYAFCKLCRDHGLKVYAAPWVRLGHMGSYLFEGLVIPVR